MPSSKETFSAVVSNVRSKITVPQRSDADLAAWRKLTEDIISKYDTVPEKFNLIREIAAMLYRVSRD